LRFSVPYIQDDTRKNSKVSEKRVKEIVVFASTLLFGSELEKDELLKDLDTIICGYDFLRLLNTSEKNVLVVNF
jgi:hypothetical protein